MINPEISSQMLKATVKVRWTHDRRKETDFWTGFVVGRAGTMVIIMTTAHQAAAHTSDITTLKTVKDFKFEVVFPGSEESFECEAETFLPKSDILLMTVTSSLEDFHPFVFATGDDRNLIHDQSIWTCSHPSGLGWCISRGAISRNRSLNKSIKEYASEMILFDHMMGIGVGSSGSAIVNKKGMVIGLQSGEVSVKRLVMRGERTLAALKNESAIKKTKKPSINLGRICFDCDDVEELSTNPCLVKHAVHIEYIEDVLRMEFSNVPGANQLNLNSLIEKHIKMIYYGSSSSGAQDSIP